MDFTLGVTINSVGKYEIKPNIPKIESCYIDGKIRYRIESAQSINGILNVDFAIHSMINKKFKIVGIFESISDNVEHLEMFLKFLKTFFCNKSYY